MIVHLSRKAGTMVLSGSLIVFGALAWVVAQSFPPGNVTATLGPGYVPKLLGGALVLVGFLDVVLEALRKDHRTITVQDPVRLVLALVLVILYLAVIPYAGFFIGTLVFLLVLLLILEPRRRFLDLIVASATVLGIWLTFVVGLKIQFPTGPWLP